MMKRILSVLLMILLVGSVAPLAFAAGEDTAAIEEEIAQCRRNMDAAHDMAENARYLGFGEDHTIIREAQGVYAVQRARYRELKAQLAQAQAAAAAPAYSEEDLDLLARLIYAEAGCTWIPDWVQQMVGSVVLNRVNSPVYPNTIREVIYQPGQYGPAYSGSIDRPADARTIANAKYLLEHGSLCPANVTGQAGFISGSGLYTSYYDPVLGTTIYFSYT